MIVVFYTLIVLFLIFLPPALAVGLRRRYRVPWLLFCVGVLTFVGAQLVHIPLNALLGRLGVLPEGLSDGGRLVQAALVLGLTAGLTEELARAVGYWLLRSARRSEDGIMLGLGHGGIEAMVLGGVLVAAQVSSLASLRGTDLQTLELPAGQLVLLQQQMELLFSSPWLALAPVLERLLALALQVSLSLIVLQAFTRRNWLYLVAAILYHAAVDAIAVYAAQRLDNVWLVEGLLAVIILPAVLWAWRQRPRPAAGPGPSIAAEMGLFLTAVRKELQQQWRTRRVLVVGAVFALFGLLAPLTIRYLPEILGSLEGAEQFAGLIPEPTIGDALAEYIDNLTQFGFLLAILLGMGVVAGEKERGTAAMVLSKPLPRWAFILSKFVAQVALFALAFLVAAVGCYYYTLFLFHAPDLGAFVSLNLLMLAWLLVFVALAVLGSTLAKSTGVAGGLAAAGTVLVLLAGSVPRLGGLMPGMLVGWARQLALGGEVTPQAGALALSLVLVVLALLVAIAAFEKQEV
ncbi:MAG: YhfC family glutamic-type intramembrane protease [Chloroflexi bacterium]|nr:YhfC family glutamic-type intramembrane protease [Chloroflexota bacterium]MCI0576472.1 YhfC family glutamic-type intramembrane protease [Chloroflexota bacterium]MCI0649552.1 YhfC family glutamic-type intramembrane protease [Chloroflexota bacterium]MCI0729372.1 YhfC family glutamic-type intramembrane protease [Chloroflexota bacterium]